MKKEKVPRQIKFVPPRKPETKTKPRIEKPPSPQIVEHRVYGQGEVLAVRVGGSGALVLDCAFHNGDHKTLLAEGAHWLTPLAKKALKPTLPIGPESKREEEVEQAA